MKKKLKNNSKGQSLVEVIASLGVVILIVAALVNLVTASLRSSNYAKTAAQANKFAQEAIEWTRSLRDRASDWASFKLQVIPSENTKTWCLKNISTWPNVPGICGATDFICSGGCTPLETTIFKREALITEDETRLKVKVTVKWSDQAGEHKSQVETIFTDTSKW